MTRPIVLINHWAIPYALHMNACDEVSHRLPHQVRCYLRTDSAARQFHESARIFKDARERGYRTVCLGVTEWPEGPSNPPDELVDCTRRFEKTQHVEQASCWTTFPWRSVAHDLQVLQEASLLLQDDTGHPPLLLCLNLLSCRDALYLQPGQRFVLGEWQNHPSFDLRLIPTTVTNTSLYARALDQCTLDLSQVLMELERVFALTSDRKAHIAMTCLSSLALGEHDLFGPSHMKEGTTSFLVTSTPCRGTEAYVDDAIKEFVSSCFEGRDMHLRPAFPYESVVRGVERRVQRVNDRLYSCVQGRVFDMTVDPDEKTDVHAGVSHLDALTSRPTIRPRPLMPPVPPPLPLPPPPPPLRSFDPPPAQPLPWESESVPVTPKPRARSIRARERQQNQRHR